MKILKLLKQNFNAKHSHFAVLKLFVTNCIIYPFAIGNKDATIKCSFFTKIK